MDYFINASVGSQNLAKALVYNGLLPKPMGVQLGATIYAAIVDTFFGFRTYALGPYNVTPFNTYTSYDMAAPWLSYSNAI